MDDRHELKSVLNWRTCFGRSKKDYGCSFNVKSGCIKRGEG